MVADEFNIKKENAEIAASISKSDLCSDLVNEYPEYKDLWENILLYLKVLKGMYLTQ